jgi:hypothetical protein
MMGEPLVADRRPPGDSVLSDWSIRRTEHLVRRKTVPPPAIAPSERKRLKQMRSLPLPPSFFRGQILSLGQRFVLSHTNCLRCHRMFHVLSYLSHVHFKVRGLLLFYATIKFRFCLAYPLMILIFRTSDLKLNDLLRLHRHLIK